MMQYMPAVAGKAHIEFESIASIRQGVFESGARVFRGKPRLPPTQAQVGQWPDATMAKQQRT